MEFLQQLFIIINIINIIVIFALIFTSDRLLKNVRASHAKTIETLESLAEKYRIALMRLHILEEWGKKKIAEEKESEFIKEVDAAIIKKFEQCEIKEYIDQAPERIKRREEQERIKNSSNAAQESFQDKHPDTKP